MTNGGALYDKMYVWNPFQAVWISFAEITPEMLPNAQEKSLSSKKKKKLYRNKRSMSNKYAGLVYHEVVMYDAIENCVQFSADVIRLILIYSQGYKFSVNDTVIYFPDSVFSGSYFGRVKKVIDDRKQ
jgi:hypothetical protein